ncbi:hypothetical protein SDC9_165247 [bioreactor metagenome]|uniref:30S ribosomal protein S2 n=1 Tax=bioreactor metagenome TaxID=1076179 RepID=A0A645FW36_9ZZZZ
MFIRSVAAEGKPILFVGTKKQAQDSIKEEAVRAGAHYVNARWLGGMLTNFQTNHKRIARLAQLRQMEEDGTFDILPKKEVIKLRLEIDKLEKFRGGLREERVVGIKEERVFSARLADRPVAGRECSQIFRLDKDPQARIECGAFFQNFGRTVRGRVVHGDHLDFAESLAEDGVQGLFQGVRRVEDRHDDGDFDILIHYFRLIC